MRKLMGGWFFRRVYRKRKVTPYDVMLIKSLCIFLQKYILSSDFLCHYDNDLFQKNQSEKLLLSGNRK